MRDPGLVARSAAGLYKPKDREKPKINGNASRLDASKLAYKPDHSPIATALAPIALNAKSGPKR